MPELLLFVPCQKVIIDAEDQTITIFSVLDTFNLVVPRGNIVPPDAAVPRQWDILTLWRTLPEDTGKAYEQRTHLILPNGQKTVENLIDVDVSGQKHRNVIHVAGFIIGQPGEAVVVLSLREKTPEADWQEVARFPIFIQHAEADEEETTDII